MYMIFFFWPLIEKFKTEQCPPKAGLMMPKQQKKSKVRKWKVRPTIKNGLTTIEAFIKEIRWFDISQLCVKCDPRSRWGVVYIPPTPHFITYISYKKKHRKRNPLIWKALCALSNLLKCGACSFWTLWFLLFFNFSTFTRGF